MEMVLIRYDSGYDQYQSNTLLTLFLRATNHAKHAPLLRALCFLSPQFKVLVLTKTVPHLFKFLVMVIASNSRRDSTEIQQAVWEGDAELTFRVLWSHSGSHDQLPPASSSGFFLWRSPLVIISSAAVVVVPPFVSLFATAKHGNDLVGIA